MSPEFQVSITILLATNTSIIAFASKLLLNKLDRHDASISEAHKRLDNHIQDAQAHCSPEKIALSRSGKRA